MVDFPDSNGVTVYDFKPSQNYMESSAWAIQACPVDEYLRAQLEY